MTIENREQVGRALELARDGLRPFVTRCFKRAPGGLDQVSVLLQGTDYEESEEPLTDIAVIVRLMLMSRTWYEVFQPGLKRTIRGGVRNLVGEVGSVRNHWAHQDAFSDDDTERALDTIHRLLRDINANQAGQAGQMLEDYRAGRQGQAPPAAEPPPHPAASVEPVAQPEPPAAPAPPQPEDRRGEAGTFEQAAAREIENLRSQIAAKRAEREGLDVRRNYLEDDQMRIVREFEENKRRIASEIDGVDAERKALAEEIRDREERLQRVEAAVALPPLRPSAPTIASAPSHPDVPQPVSTPVIAKEVDTAPEPAPHLPRRGSGASATTADLVCELLAEAETPLHYREIYNKLRYREPNPPRSDDPATALLARYFNDPRLERTGKGTYALRSAPRQR